MAAQQDNVHNIQNEITGIADLDAILNQSRDAWLTAEQLHVIFTHRHRYVPINNTLIPVNREGIYRADCTTNFDNNNWEITSEQRKIKPANRAYKFDIRFGEGADVHYNEFYIGEGEGAELIQEWFVLRRWVVRDQSTYGTCTFIHYRFEEL